MPFRNAERFLDASISSILKQTFHEFELIIINDASTDGSDIVIQKYINDPRIIYIKNDRRLTQPPNLNHGLKIARSNFIARLDGDDVSVPERLESQYNFLNNHPDVALVGSHIELIDEQGQVIQRLKKPVGSEYIKKVCFYYSPFAHPAIMFRKDIVDKVGNYRPKYLNREDIDLYFRLIYSGFKTDNISEYLTQYRQHEGNVSSQHRQNGVLSFRLKKETIKAFNLRLGVMDKSSMYIHYWLDMILSHKQKMAVEKLIKRSVDQKHQEAHAEI